MTKKSDKKPKKARRPAAGSRLDSAPEGPKPVAGSKEAVAPGKSGASRRISNEPDESDEPDKSDEKPARLNLIFLKNLSFEEAARQKASLLLKKKSQDRREPEPPEEPLTEPPPPQESPGMKTGEPLGLLDSLNASFEKAFIEAALLISRGDQTKTADLLGLNRNTLRKKMDGFQIRASSFFQKDVRGEISGRDMIVSSYEDLDLEEAVRRKLWILQESASKIPDLTAEVRPAVEKAVIETGLKYCKGRKTKAAALLGLSRVTLNSKIKLYKIPDFKEK